MSKLKKKLCTYLFNLFIYYYYSEYNGKFLAVKFKRNKLNAPIYVIDILKTQMKKWGYSLGWYYDATKCKIVLFTCKQ